MTATHKKHVFLKDLHFEHRLWLDELSFSKDQLGVFTTRLAEVEEKNTASDFKVYAESFQNRLIRQKEVIDKLSYDIKEHETALVDYAEEFPIAIDHVHFSDHDKLREKMIRFTALYAEFKGEFMRFLAKWM